MHDSSHRELLEKNVHNIDNSVLRKYFCANRMTILIKVVIILIQNHEEK